MNKNYYKLYLKYKNKYLYLKKSINSQTSTKLFGGDSHDLSKKNKYTLETAKKAARKGSDSLKKWVIGFLRGTGDNIKLARSIEIENVKCKLVKNYDLSQLVRINGPPEENLKYVDENWHEKIQSLMGAISSGEYIPTPLIVFDKWENPFVDGAHRLDALQKLGYETYWTIVINIL